jgi:lysophospholipid acyltransferase (LPLAT)-like uncharacterized protein
MRREAVLGVVGAWLLKVWFRTLRLGFEDRPGVLDGRIEGPVIFCFWHNRILGITMAFRRVYPRGRGGVSVLTSPSSDGEILARVAGAFGMGAVRGSSSRRGSRALMELIRLVREGGDVAITPDGPRGPRYVLGPGVVQLAQTTGARILPVHARFSRCVRMRTWDGFVVPLPFSRVSVTVGDPVVVASDLDGEAFESARRNLEDVLRDEAD